LPNDRNTTQDTLFTEQKDSSNFSLTAKTFWFQLATPSRCNY